MQYQCNTKLGPQICYKSSLVIIEIFALTKHLFINKFSCLLFGCLISSSRAISEVGEDEVRVMALLPGYLEEFLSCHFLKQFSHNMRTCLFGILGCLWFSVLFHP